MIFSEILYLFLALVISSIFGSIVVPNILVVSFKKRLFDHPDARKIHTSVVPRLGGVAFTPIVLFTISLLVSMSVLGVWDVADYRLDDDIAIFMLGLCSLILLYFVGLKDDLVGVSYRAKFAIQTICAMMLIASGVKVDNLYGFLFLDNLSPIVSMLTTLFLVVFVVNSINLIDGMDGLASGLSIIALGYYGVCFALSHRVLCAMLAFSTLGVLIPFFYYNVFGGRTSHCRKIFMGDTGALTVGFILAFLSVRMLTINDIGEGNNLFLAFAPLIVPCSDVIRVALSRMSRGRDPFKPDRNHIHHKFLAVGFSHRISLISILVLSLAFTMSVIWLSRCVDANVLALFVVVVWMVLNRVLGWLKERLAV